MIPSGTITYPNADTAIDLVWDNEKAVDNMLKCKLAEMHDVRSDHFLIQTEITITNNLKESTAEPNFNYAKTNWKLFTSQLKENISSMTIPQICRTQTDIDNYTKRLVSAV